MREFVVNLPWLITPRKVEDASAQDASRQPMYVVTADVLVGSDGGVQTAAPFTAKTAASATQTKVFMFGFLCV